LKKRQDYFQGFLKKDCSVDFEYMLYLGKSSSIVKITRNKQGEVVYLVRLKELVKWWKEPS